MKLWGGRFEKDTSKAMDAFHASLPFDSRLYRQDILGSLAHVRMLVRCGILPETDGSAIEEGLKGILDDMETGRLPVVGDEEDIHTRVEHLLTERIGENGKKLHTARSRNDQVALDMRMYVREETRELIRRLASLGLVLADAASQHLETFMPGYTHLQRAQPITLAHHLMAWAEMYRRDIERLSSSRERTDVLPLGACALAGTTYPTDPRVTAEELGFPAVSRNSLDAVSDRDFILETSGCLSLIMMHLSRCCEEVILWSSAEFGFLELDDAYSTGSSIMPQKKNPDAAELIRGKTGRVYGSMTALFTTMKSLPLAYNKDMQEDKEVFFDAVDTVKACLAIFTGMIATCRFRPEAMRKAALTGFANATDLADYLVRRGIPFRTAHEITGKVVRECLHRQIALEDLPLDEFQRFSDRINRDVYAAVSLETCVRERQTAGGPAAQSVRAQVDEVVRFFQGFSGIPQQ